MFRREVLDFHLCGKMPNHSWNTHRLFRSRRSCSCCCCTWDLSSLKPKPSTLDSKVSTIPGSIPAPWRRDIPPWACIGNLPHIRLKQNDFHIFSWGLSFPIDLQQTPFFTPSHFIAVKFEANSSHSGVNNVMASRFAFCSWNAKHSFLCLQCNPAPHSPSNVKYTGCLKKNRV